MGLSHRPKATSKQTGAPGRRISESLAHRSLLGCALVGWVLAGWVLTGCGGDGERLGATGSAAIETAKRVDPNTFPQTDGAKTLVQIRDEAGALPSDLTALSPAANNFVAGRVNRYPFGLFTVDREPVWGPTVIYVATSRDGAAQGPFAAAVNSLDVPVRYRSKTSAPDYETIGNGFYSATFKAAANVRSVTVMTLTRSGDTVRSALSELKLVRDDPTPAPGERAPAVKTETIEDGGDAEEICTRDPVDDMHDVSLDDALGRGKPVVLLFSTPALCSSRVCGPVNDVATQVQAEVGDRAVFVHQEIFNDNDPTAGFRPQVLKYGLTSEPYTFVIDGDGRVSSQLAGPFSAEELRAALREAGLK